MPDPLAPAAPQNDSSALSSPRDAAAQLWEAVGLEAGALERLDLIGADPALPSSFAVGAAAQASIAAAGLAATEIWRLRGGEAQRVAVDMRHAAAEFRSERYLRVGGETPPDPWDKIAGAYRCGDGKWIRVHTNFPHHRDGVLDLLGCSYDKEAVSAALRDWSALSFEQSASERGLVVAAMRSFEEWDAHPQALALAQLPVISIEKIGEADPMPFAPGAQRPLDGVKVLDLTRIIAGPVCGRTLASHGADVMLVSSPLQPFIPSLVIDTGRGKRSCYLHLTHEEGREGLDTLLGEADVFVQGYRPGGLTELGFGPEDCAARAGPASSTSRSAPTATRVPGRTSAASIRWCRPPPA